MSMTRTIVSDWNRDPETALRQKGLERTPVGGRMPSGARIRVPPTPWHGMGLERIDIGGVWPGLTDCATPPDGKVRVVDRSFDHSGVDLTDRLQGDLDGHVRAVCRRDVNRSREKSRDATCREGKEPGNTTISMANRP